MLPRWLSRISGTSDEIGEADFTTTLLQQQHALRMPCPFPTCFPSTLGQQHLRNGCRLAGSLVLPAATITLIRWLLPACHNPALPQWLLDLA